LEDEKHISDLEGFLFVIVLIDAKCIDPQISLLVRVSQVSECGGQMWGYVMLKSIQGYRAILG
jgi:hypothetical protein